MGQKDIKSNPHGTGNASPDAELYYILDYVRALQRALRYANFAHTHTQSLGKDFGHTGVRISTFWTYWVQILDIWGPDRDKIVSNSEKLGKIIKYPEKSWKIVKIRQNFSKNGKTLF